MPFRFRRTIRIAPGIRLNFNKGSVSVRVGGRGAGVTLSSHGKLTRTVGLPGTGVSWTETEQIAGGTRDERSGAASGCGMLLLAGCVVSALLVVVAVLVSCSGPARSSSTNVPPSPAAPLETARAAATGTTGASWRVTAVVDGDTVDVVSTSGHTERIRVIGIDTPERGECGYADATSALHRMITGKHVLLVPGARDDRDHYGRLLRYIDVADVDAGLQQIKTGVAIARYDSRDGYGRHTREAAYVAADAASPNVCGRSSPGSTAPSSSGSAGSGAVQTFRSCAALNAVYPGGVARVGVTGNLVSGALRPFGTPPVFDDALYQANRGRDGDADGIACER